MIATKTTIHGALTVGKKATLGAHISRISDPHLPYARNALRSSIVTTVTGLTGSGATVVGGINPSSTDGGGVLATTFFFLEASGLGVISIGAGDATVVQSGSGWAVGDTITFSAADLNASIGGTASGDLNILLTTTKIATSNFMAGTNTGDSEKITIPAMVFTFCKIQVGPTQCEALTLTLSTVAGFTTIYTGIMQSTDRFNQVTAAKLIPKGFRIVAGETALSLATATSGIPAWANDSSTLVTVLTENVNSPAGNEFLLSAARLDSFVWSPGGIGRGEITTSSGIGDGNLMVVVQIEVARGKIMSTSNGGMIGVSLDIEKR